MHFFPSLFKIYNAD